MFLFTFTSFGIVRILGGPRHPTIEVEIWRLTTQAFDLRTAAVLALLQLIAVTGLMLWWSNVQSRQAVTLRLRPRGTRRLAPHGPPARARGLHRRRSGGDRRHRPSAALVAGSLRGGDGLGLSAWRALGAAPGRGPASRPVADPLATVGTSLRFAVLATVVAVVIGAMRGRRHRRLPPGRLAARRRPDAAARRRRPSPSGSGC